MKTQYTQYTPIPSQVPKQLALDIIQSHGEMITVNPLVLDYHPIKAPRDCPNDEYYSTWYEINQRIQFVPGLKKMGSSKVSFKGCFHDMPWGVQTHMYIPMGIDLRNKWIIKGNQPGEPPEPRELGSGAPSSGLYLKQEVEIKCNPLAVSFVKKEMKASAQIMVERMIKKAELLDSGVLQGAFEDGKLKTYNPADRTQAPMPGSPGPMSPGFVSRFRPDSTQSMPYAPNDRISTYSSYSQFAGSNRETPNTNGQVPHPEGKGFAVELPGDYLYPSDVAAPNRRMSDRYSQASGSDRSQENRDSRWSFVSSDNRSNHGTPRHDSFAASPSLDQKTFSAELPGSGHKDFEVNRSTPPPRPANKTPPPGRQQQSVPVHQTYNPQNYARFTGNQYA